MSAQRGTVVPEIRQRDDPAAYMRLWRSRQREKQRVHDLGSLARATAALRVAKAHPAEFDKALRDERVKRGLSA